MTVGLDGVRVKLRRAGLHIAELRTRLAPLADEATNSIVGAPADDNPSKLVYRVTHMPGIDPIVSAVVGDIVHNLGSALDHLACQLVMLDSGQPNDSTVFPIHKSNTDRSGKSMDLTIKPGIRDRRILEAVERMQPYTEANFGNDPATNALWIIKRLDIIDKHRLLLTVVHTINFDLPAYWGSNEGDPAPICWFNPNSLAVDDDVATFDFGGAAPPEDFDPHLSLAITIDERDANWGRGRDLVEFMDGLWRGLASEINLHIVGLMGERWLELS
jgi:hypothetical protein